MIETRALCRYAMTVPLSLAMLTPSLSYAKDIFRTEVLDECPVVSNIRVATSSSPTRLSSLAACSDRLVAAPPTPVEPGPDIVRIIGVKPDPDEMRDDPGFSRSSWPAVTAPTGTVTKLSYSQFDDAINQAAGRHRIDPLFLHAVIATESAYRANAVSHAGARGLMQIMPATGRGLGVAERALFDPAINIDAGARHLKKLQRRYGTNFDLILSAYNAGEGAVARYGNRIPPYAETRAYVGRVMARYHQLRGTGPVR